LPAGRRDFGALFGKWTSRSLPRQWRVPSDKEPPFRFDHQAYYYSVAESEGKKNDSKEEEEALLLFSK
jgi:hypothetical protein